MTLRYKDKSNWSKNKLILNDHEPGTIEETIIDDIMSGGTIQVEQSTRLTIPAKWEIVIEAIG